MAINVPEIQYLNLPAIYKAVADTRNAQISNRLNQLQMAEYERKLTEGNALNEAYNKAFVAPQPEQTLQPQMSEAMPSYTGNALAMNYGGPSVNIPARAGGIDYNAVQSNLAASGQAQLIPGIQEKQQEQRTAHIKEVISLAAVNPDAAVKMWNSGPMSNLGQVEHIGSDAEMQYFQNPKTGAISGISKKRPIKPDGTPNITVFNKGNQEEPNLTEEQLTARALKGDTSAQTILNAMQKRKIEISKSTNGGGMQLTPDALKSLGDRFNITGEIPGMGMGKAATEARTKVLNQWASDLKNSGTSVAEQTAKQAAYKASRNELSKLQSQRGTVMAFANTAEKNLALVQDLSAKVDRTGIPVMNRWILSGKRSIAGDPEVAKFDAAVRTAINEYAKVTSSATGGGVTSDMARKEVESMLNTAQTKEQVEQVIGLLRQEMKNRKEGYDQQIESIKQSITGGSTPAGSNNRPLPKF